MSRPCPSCRHAADACSYPGEARLGCLLDKRKRDEMTATMGATGIQYARAKIKLRALFPDATRIEINPQRLEIGACPCCRCRPLLSS